VEQVLKKMNYTPNAIARSLAVNTTKTIGVLTSDVRDSYYANAIYTIEQEFGNLGYNVILSNTGGAVKKKREYIKIMLEKKVDGIILVGSVFKEKGSNRHIYDAALKVPVIMLNSTLAGENIYSVVCDDARATMEIVGWLYERGYRNIIYFYDVESFSGLAKIRGFRKAMEEKQLRLGKDVLLQVSSGLEGGYEGVEYLDRNGVIYDAIVASDDLIAAGALKGLMKIGKRVPEDVAVFGYNNSQISRCTTPELSTVDNKVSILAAEAVKMLYDVLAGKEVASKKVIIPELVIKGSS
jgi:LacI family transcriptional regulator